MTISPAQGQNAQEQSIIRGWNNDYILQNGIIAGNLLWDFDRQKLPKGWSPP